MDKSTQAGPSLEEVLADALEDELDADTHTGVLRMKLDERLELLGGGDADGAIRAGLPFVRFGSLLNLKGDGSIEDDDGADYEPVGRDELDELGRDLAEVIRTGRRTDPERAAAIRDLTEAYTTLAAELCLTTPRVIAPGQPLPPIVDNEELLRGIWRRLNDPDGPRIPTELIDAIVDVVRAELARPVTEERQA